MKKHKLTIVEANLFIEMLGSCVAGKIAKMQLTLNNDASTIILASDGTSEVSIAILEEAEREACKQAIREPIDKSS